MVTKSLFVSHISEEAEVSALLKAMLQEDFLDLAKVFTSSDIGSIGAGENWLSAVERALGEARAVIVLCSKASVQRPWVQFEVGAAWMKGIPIIPVCHSGLRLGELQMPLSLRQGVELASERGIRQLYDGVARALKMTGTPNPASLPQRLRQIKDVEARFLLGAIQQFELFMDIILPYPARLDVETIPDDAGVELEGASLQLFGFLTGEGLTWRDIVKAAKRTPDTRWLRQLQRCVYLASNNERFRPVQAIYHTESGSYQPQLSKKEVRTDGSTRFHIHLVDTVVAPLTEVQNEFGLLATLLRLGLRFRYEVIERFQKLSRSGNGPGGKRYSTPELLQMLHEAVETIENDALSRGAEQMDRDAVSALFSRGEDQVAMEKVQDEWGEARAVLFCATNPCSASDLTDVLARMRAINYRFMSLGTRRFHELIDLRWSDVKPASAAPIEATGL